MKFLAKFMQILNKKIPTIDMAGKPKTTYEKTKIN